MNLFTAIPESQAIVHCRGVYRQTPVYERGGKIYAKYGAGFVRLSQGGSTSAPSVRWSCLDIVDGSYEERGGSVFFNADIVEAAE